MLFSTTWRRNTVKRDNVNLTVTIGFSAMMSIFHPRRMVMIVAFLCSNMHNAWPVANPSISAKMIWTFSDEGWYGKLFGTIWCGLSFFIYISFKKFYVLWSYSFIYVVFKKIKKKIKAQNLKKIRKKLKKKKKSQKIIKKKKISKRKLKSSKI